MRKAFVSHLVELAERDSRIVLMTADLGYTVLEPFADRFPGRFFNVGVAEQNAIGLATGLAEAGFIPFVYSIVTFASLRPYEFIRNGPILHQLPVRIVGVGGGFEYGHAGPTHHGLEDIGVMRVQPGISIVAPADYEQAHSALDCTWNVPGPVYYRLGKNDRDVIPGLNGEYEPGRLQIIREGTDLVLLSTGSIAFEAVDVAEKLANRGISCALGVIASISPAPIDDLVDLLSRFPLVLTLEAHYLNGGIGSLTAEVVADYGLECRALRHGVKSVPDGISGGEVFMHQKHGLDADSIVKAVLKVLQPQKSK